MAHEIQRDTDEEVDRSIVGSLPKTWKARGIIIIGYPARDPELTNACRTGWRKPGLGR